MAGFTGHLHRCGTCSSGVGKHTCRDRLCRGGSVAGHRGRGQGTGDFLIFTFHVLGELCIYSLCSKRTFNKALTFFFSVNVLWSSRPSVISEVYEPWNMVSGLWGFCLGRGETFLLSLSQIYPRNRVDWDWGIV